ncbi:hypothetical protein [Mycobacterium sp. 852002-30065_SCH5024008]|uniref:hypothetical protein n=1 Tax=Mycobacterium sp. 852002-30065_SCH5024008 TaxID=1834088 RepID=UPI0008001063|nr:hypothetical protein [Mycobacterium sp. 852002-30065_SCH5024008]OBB90355.1 hypothetical protein A5781_23250 [Mycobacterium sp. 852002-30065_SCH5024008]
MAANSFRTRRTARRLLAIWCVAVTAAGLFVAWRIDERTQPCWAVRQFIDFNRDTQASFKAKTRFAPPGSYEQNSVPADADYQAWLDGLQRRANEVTAPGLSAHAQRAAALAREFMNDANQMNDDLGRQDPLKAELPPSAKAVARVNQEFGDEMATLARACPA